MKIFSTFDTKLRNTTLTREQNIHGISQVLCIKRSGFFLFKMIVIPLFCISILSAGLTYIMLTQFKRNTTISTIGTSIIFTLLCFSFNIFKNCIDYYMDFCIITPNEVILTEQSGIFTRTIKTLDVIKIRSISIQQKKIIDSLFNDGSIIFMSDGDNELGEISINDIHNPEKQKQRIQEIMAKE